MILILTTFKNRKEAHDLGKKLLNKKLIACYSLLPVESVYWWKGKIVGGNEILMILKTNKNFSEVEKYILKYHSYETPEIIAIKPSAVTGKYLKWIEGF